ncbi:unnamed protein product [Symbiodinium sp. CCMP2592]|nr:unnamed protein product [Symbiodinium sp. CCMP2592]
MHNHHSAAFDGKNSPQELVLQRPLPACASTLIGMTVLAELPNSMKKTSLSRFVEAAYLYPEAGGLTHVVSSLVNGTPHHYRAKSIKRITPMKVGFEHCEHLLKVYDPKDTLAPPMLKELDDGIPTEVQGEVDKAFEGKVSQGPTADMSQVGPPAAWVREHGGTPGCPACGEKRGKANHNAACKRRYDTWLKDQSQRLVGDGEQRSVEGEPGLGSTTPPKVSSEARSSENAGVPGVSAPSLKRPKTSDERTGLGSEAPSAASKPDVVDVEMFEDPSLPYEQVPDEEMAPGYFEGEQPMEVEKDLDEGTEPMSVESGDVPSDPSRVPRLLEQVKPAGWLHPRLDSSEGLNHAVGEHEAPKLANVVNAVLIEKNTAFPEQVKMCGSKVWLAKMKSALSELDGCPLDAHSFAKKHGIRIIPTRWVLGHKVVNGKDSVRARCVVQDVAKGSTASSLGLSATTPSLEALRTLLAIAAKDSMDIATLEVSTAFLHSPLPKGERAVIMLPRDAWNLKLANVVKTVGLTQCPTEPSVFEGTVKGKRFLTLCYVDDLKRVASLRLEVLSSPPDIVKTIEKGLLGGVSLVQTWPVGCPSFPKVPDAGPSRIDIYADASWAPQAELRSILTAVQESEGIATLIGQLANGKDSGGRDSESGLVSHVCDGRRYFDKMFEHGVVRMICGVKLCRLAQLDDDLSMDRNTECSSPQADWIPETGSLDRSLDMVTAVQNQEVIAPFWCKMCKWLFKNEESYGLNKAKEGFVCGKCESKITVMGSAAQHAFNMREKDKTKRWGPKDDGKDHTSEQAPMTPAPAGLEDNIGGSAQPDPLLPWVAGLGDEKGTPEWYNGVHDSVCRKGTPYREMIGEFERLISLLSEDEKAKYDKDYKSLKHQNQGIFAACEEAGSFAAFEKLIMVPRGISGLSLATFVCGLCQKGSTPLVLVGDAVDLSVRRMMDLFSMLPMIGAEICVDAEAQKDQHPEWLKEWQRTDCLALTVVCNGIRWVAELMCQSVLNKDPNGVLPKWAFWVYSNYKETRPALSWDCNCPLHSSNVYVLKHKVYLPVHLLVNVVTLVVKHLCELKEEMLQLEALMGKEVTRQQLQQELKRKSEEREKEEEAKRPRVEEPTAQAATAPVVGGVLQFAMTEEAYARLGEMRAAAQDRRQALVAEASKGAEDDK